MMKQLFNYLKNCWRFREELSDFKDWDYSFNLKLFRKSIFFTKEYIKHKGHEVDETRLPKIDKMERAIYLLDCFDKNCFMKLAEEQLGYKYTYSDAWDKVGDDYYEFKNNLSVRELNKNSAIMRIAEEIEEEYWNELWEIIKEDIRAWWD